MKRIIAFSIATVLLSGPLMAADFPKDGQAPAVDADILPPASDPQPFIDELRLGGFLHDLLSPEKHAGPDLNAELLFAKPFGNRAQWWLPRPNLGGTADFNGGTSTLYGGMAWQYNLTSWSFVEASFGGALTNGKHGEYDSDRNAMGCSWSFRESASLGFDVSEHWRIMGTLEHYSNAGICDHNRGLTNYGARIGYKF